METDRAIYGFKYIERALELGAIQRLLISDNLFRSHDLEKRQYYVLS